MTTYFSCSDHCPFSRSQRQDAFVFFEIYPQQMDFKQMPGGTNGIQVRFVATYSSLKTNRYNLKKIAIHKI